MTRKIILSIAMLLLVAGFSSCVMHGVYGTPYHIWYPYGRFHHHWGRERHMNVRHAYWGHHRYGMRPHNYRGHFH